MSAEAGSSGEQQRSKRQKVDKTSKFDRLKQLKGSKNKYEIGDVDSVYDLVDEQEYAKRYSDVGHEKWIVDDGTGYVEDGRDIFDEDDGDDDENAVKANQKAKKTKTKKKLSDLQTAAVTTGSDIRGLIAKMPQNFETPKSKNSDVDVNALLDNLLSEDDPLEFADNRKRKVNLLEQIENEKRAVSNYMGSYNVDQSYVIARKKVTVRSKSASTPRRQTTETDVMNVTPLEQTVCEKVAAEESIRVPDAGNESVAMETTDDNRADLSESIFDSCDFPSPEMTAVPDEAAPEPEPNLSDIMDDYDFDIGDNSLEREEERVAAGVATATTDELQDPTNEPDTDPELFHFYWLDAYEDPFLAPGTIFLFGRSRLPRPPNRQQPPDYETCCVIVRNVRKTVYFLPRTEHTDRNELIEEIDLTVFKSKLRETNYRFVRKKFVFDASVPHTAEYLQVDYPATFDAIDGTRAGHNFRRVFGAGQTCMERFLLQRRFRGPCWLQLKNVRQSSNKTSHCKREMIVESEDCVEISELNPRLNLPTIVSLTFDCFLSQNPKSLQPEIVMISCIFDKRFSLEKSSKFFHAREYFCAYTKPSHKPLPVDLPKTDIEIDRNCKFVQLSSERSLISCFLAKLTQHDPDIVIGHDLFGYKINVLCDRLKVYAMSNWSLLGRLNRTTKIQKLQPLHLYKTALLGRLVCDLKTAAKDSNLKCRSYDLATLSQTILRNGPAAASVANDIGDLNMYVVEKLFGNATAIVQLMHKLVASADLIVRVIMEIKAVPLALQITKIAGNVMSATLQGGRSERNEFLLLHAFFDSGFIVPDRQKKKPIGSVAGKSGDGGGGGDGGETESQQVVAPVESKQSYEGGLVLQPQIGLYDSFILLMDFNSLYPSIIQEFNICFTTLVPNETSNAQQLGILPLEIQRLVESRKQVKKLLKASNLTDEMRLQYNIRQMALKLTANSMYGCLGFAHSRFFAKHLAAKITQYGREILTSTRDLAERYGYEVIYGDTDSIMINTNTQDFDSVNKIAAKLKFDINKLYRFVEIDIDGIYKSLLLIKKKKYAGLLIKKRSEDGQQLQLELETKGLDMVRRDWSQISARASEVVLKEILSEKPFDERVHNIYRHMEKLRMDLEAMRIPKSMFEITKQITKDLKQYKMNVQSLPHVIVAMRLSQKKNYRKGDTVSYVICENGTSLPAMQRAYHLDELAEAEAEVAASDEQSTAKLKIDTAYYLGQQIFPVVLRLCQPVHGIDLQKLAASLNVKDFVASKLPPATADNPDGNQDDETGTDVADTFAASQSERSFRFRCGQCKHTKQIKSGFVQLTPFGDHIPFLLEPCTLTSECGFVPLNALAAIKNRLRFTLNRYMSVYYRAPFHCSNLTCSARTRLLSNQFKNGSLIVCRACRKGFLRPEISDEMLYDSLMFLKSLFTINDKVINLDQDVIQAFNQLEAIVNEYLNLSAYYVRNLKSIFAAYNRTAVSKFYQKFSKFYAARTIAT